MKIHQLLYLLLLLACSASKTTGISTSSGIDGNRSIKTGAEQTEKYLPMLRGKRVAMLANPSSIIGERHLVDSLKSLGVNIVKVFGPEHGFRGNASAGAVVGDEVDQATGI